MQEEWTVIERDNIYQPWVVCCDGQWVHTFNTREDAARFARRQAAKSRQAMEDQEYASNDTTIRHDRPVR